MKNGVARPRARFRFLISFRKNSSVDRLHSSSLADASGTFRVRISGKHRLKNLPAVFALRTVTGQNVTKANLHMEAAYTDSVTGGLVGELIQAATGGEVQDNADMTLGHLKGVLDKWAVKAAEGFAKARK